MNKIKTEGNTITKAHGNQPFGIGRLSPPRPEKKVKQETYILTTVGVNRPQANSTGTLPNLPHANITKNLNEQKDHCQGPQQEVLPEEVTKEHRAARTAEQHLQAKK